MTRFVWIIAIVLFLQSFVLTTGVSREAKWRCEEMRWVGEPALLQGVYQGRLESECQLEVQNPDIKSLYSAIETTLFTRAEFLSPPAKVRLEGLNGTKFDVRNRLDHGDDQLTTVEDIFLVTDQKSQLLYSTRSRKVEAEGMAGYLKRVEFNARFTVDSHSIQLRMENAVHVERPWYALAPIFKWIAGNVSRSKFEEIQERLLPFFSKNLGKTA